MAWKVEVDWERDSNYSGTYDDITEYVRELQWELGCRPFVLMADENFAQITVHNGDYRFSPENSSSPLYGYLKPNTPIRIKLDDTVMWTGFLRNVRPEPADGNKQQAQLECSGIKENLERIRLYIPLYENVTADEVIEDIVSQVSQPPAAPGLWSLGVPGFSELGVSTRLGALTDLAELDTGVNVFSYVGDNFQGDEFQKNAYDIIFELVNAERGRFFIDRGGKAIFWNRHHLLNDVSVDYTIDNDAREMVYSTPFETLVNYVEVTCYPREEAGVDTTILWELGAPVTIGPFQSKTIYAPLKDETGKSIGATDFIAPSGADVSIGTGGTLDITPDGQRARIVLTNTTGSPITLDTLKLRGRRINTFYPVTVEAYDEDSIATYGRRALILDLPALEDPDTAQDIAGYELFRLKNDIGRMESITLFDQVTDESHRQIGMAMGDLIRVIDTATGHDENYHIVGERHKLKVEGKVLESEYMLEPASATTYWSLGIAGLSELGVTTVLGF